MATGSVGFGSNFMVLVARFGLGEYFLDGGAGTDILFVGQVVVKNPSDDTLTKVLSSYVPSRRSSLVNITNRINVTFDPAGADNMVGGAGVDWFWTPGAPDITDRLATEPLNAVP